MTLYWTKRGDRAKVGYFQIVPWPFPGTDVENEDEALADLDRISNIYPRYPSFPIPLY